MTYLGISNRPAVQLCRLHTSDHNSFLNLGYLFNVLVPLQVIHNTIYF